MSNKACADLYTSIIEDVIVESRQDFENAGIDEQTLQDLREIWRQKLLASRVATFPWAEQEDEDEETNTVNTQTASNPPEGTLLLNEEDAEEKNKEILIKPEEEDRQFPDEEGSNNDINSNQDSNDINNLNMLAIPGLNQNDGLIVPRNNNDGKLEKLKKLKKAKSITFTIRNNQLDGAFGGSDDDDDDDDDDDLGSDLGADSDAINSDLDDSDDEDDDDADGEDGDEDGAGNDIEQNIMLCLYDRVQRVRNRWKCSLKDGLMNINGKDYVFQKASGDSEW